MTNLSSGHKKGKEAIVILELQFVSLELCFLNVKYKVMVTVVSREELQTCKTIYSIPVI